MNKTFAALVERLHPSFEGLLACSPVMGGALPGLRKETRGVYLFTEPGTGHLYVGRSNRLLARYKNHWMPKKTDREAAFAFRLARHVTGRLKATYKAGEGSRKALAADPDFKQAFDEAKVRVKAMEYRWVEEGDPLTQCLLEVYVAVSLATPFNDFDTH